MAGKKGYGWVFVEPKAKPISDFQKKEIESRCQILIEEFRTQFIQEANPDSGYTTDIFGKWYRHYFYFCQLMKYDSPDFRVNEAEYKFARLECFANNTFGLSYFRHTGQWWQIFEGQTLESCLESIKTDPIFHP